MEFSFNCYGHENIVAKHKTTLEFTKDSELSLKGDCIVGVNADFSLEEIKRFIKTIGNKKITIIIETIDEEYNEKNIKNNYNKNKINNNSNKIVEKINAEINPNFNSNKEMVIRKTDFISERTFAINADKAAFELDRSLIEFLKREENKVRVVVESEI
tara:strand:+ start:10535 stop:11008 length:474 start_codon:yes stop_codon:yes gene_type:complete